LLRRRSDRIETAIMTAILAAFLGAAPAAAIAAVGTNTTTASYRPGAARWTPPLTHANTFGRPQAAAAEAATKAAGTGGEAAAEAAGKVARAAVASAAAQWPGVPSRFAGSIPGHAQPGNRADLLCVFAVVMLASTAVLAGLASHWLLERKRLAAWEDEWSIIGPRWTNTGR
jgi:hypothetical protein